jgi:HSP20 family protein
MALQVPVDEGVPPIKVYLSTRHGRHKKFSTMCFSHHHGMNRGCGQAARESRMQGFRRNWHQPPVNIEEFEDRYELYLVAPGRSKSDFQLHVMGDILTVSCRKQEESDLASGASRLHQEFRTAAFERQFLLNEKIDAENISARYEDGVLVVTLLKVPGAQTPAKDIYVA